MERDGEKGNNSVENAKKYKPFVNNEVGMDEAISSQMWSTPQSAQWAQSSTIVTVCGMQYDCPQHVSQRNLWASCILWKMLHATMHIQASQINRWRGLEGHGRPLTSIGQSNYRCTQRLVKNSELCVHLSHISSQRTNAYVLQYHRWAWRHYSLIPLLAKVTYDIACLSICLNMYELVCFVCLHCVSWPNQEYNYGCVRQYLWHNPN